MGSAKVDTLRTSGPQVKSPHSKYRYRVLVLALFGACLLYTWRPQSIAKLSRPSSALDWSPCPDNATFYCSFFTVPLDYSAPWEDDKTHIAMRMYPASVGSDERLGSVFTNPGVSCKSLQTGLLGYFSSPCE